MNIEVLQKWIELPIIQILFVEIVVLGIVIAIKKIIGME